MEISEHFLAHDIKVKRVSSITTLWVNDIYFESVPALVFVDVDGYGGPTQVVDHLLLFRKDMPHVTTVLLSSDFSSNDFSVDRLAICDCSISCAQSLPNLEIALEQAFLNNAIWLDRQRKRLQHDDVVDVRLTIALILSAIAGLAGGLFALLELQSWGYAALAYICTGQATLIALLLLPISTRFASRLLARRFRLRFSSLGLKE